MIGISIIAIPSNNNDIPILMIAFMLDFVINYSFLPSKGQLEKSIFERKATNAHTSLPNFFFVNSAHVFGTERDDAPAAFRVNYFFLLFFTGAAFLTVFLGVVFGAAFFFAIGLYLMIRLY